MLHKARYEVEGGEGSLKYLRDRSLRCEKVREGIRRSVGSHMKESNQLQTSSKVEVRCRSHRAIMVVSERFPLMDERIHDREERVEGIRPDPGWRDRLEESTHIDDGRTDRGIVGGTELIKDRGNEGWSEVG